MDKLEFIKKYNMKELFESDGFLIEIVYATANNFTKQIIYQSPICMLREGTAKKLINANHILNSKGYKLKIWDSFRPLIFQKRMFEIFPDENFVANPNSEDCPHCKGSAIDLTLCTLDGKELSMPTEFDHFGPECSRNYYNNLSQNIKQNVLLLENTMKECGFIPYEYEWWHFDDKDEYGIISEMYEANKYDRLFNMCKKGIPLTQENVGDGMILVDRGTFQLIIPSDNTDEHGDFFINSIKGHDCFSYDSKSTLVYRVLDGEGEFIIEDESSFVKPGDIITIQPNTIFAYKGKMLIILEMTPNFKEEYDHFVKKVDYDVDR